MFQKLKEIKIIGVDDGRFKKNYRKTLLLAVLMKDYKIIDVRITDILVDGLNSTEAIQEMLSDVQFDIVMLSGISFAGFNIVDIHYLNKKLRKPIIVITGDKPSSREILRALKLHFQDWKTRWSFITKAGKIHRTTTNKRYKPIFYEVIGMDYIEAREIIREMAIIGRYPEPIRIVRLIAKQLTTH